MIAIEVEITAVPLCPVHFTRMKSSEFKSQVPYIEEVKVTPSRQCGEPGCIYTYSMSSGYFKFREGERPEREETLWALCRAHRHPRYISEYDSQSKIATWRCPKARCETVKKSRME